MAVKKQVMDDSILGESFDYSLSTAFTTDLREEEEKMVQSWGVRVRGKMVEAREGARFAVLPQVGLSRLAIFLVPRPHHDSTHPQPCSASFRFVSAYQPTGGACAFNW